MNSISVTLNRFIRNKNTVTIAGVVIILIILYFGYTSTINSAVTPVSVPVAATTIQPRTLITEEMVTTVDIAAKAVSDVILLDNDFSHLPLVFKEGRRVVSNIMRSVLLFLTKSFFIGIFSFLSVFMSTGLPIEIESIYIYEFISIALCGFLLSIQQTSPEPIKGNFVTNVISKSVVFGALLTLSGLIPVIVNALVPGGIEHWASLIVANVTISGLCVLLYICYPFKKYTVMVSCIGIVLSILASLALPDVFFNPGYLKQANNLGEQFKLIFDDLFNLTLFKSFQYYEWIMVAIYLVIAPLLLIALMKLRSLIIKNKERIKSKFLKAIKGKVKE